MKNTVKSNFSLRKLILTALVAGPVAILPAPLWALPSTASTNLTTSTGVQVVTAGTALNITSPDKGILTWVDFGGNGQTIASTDTLNYILPSASASVLNLVSGANTTTINGALVSNGNVYVMNPNGIVIGSGATINTGGFYASAINEPLAASYFASTGTLSFVGTGNGVVQVSHTNANSTAPVFQALGSGNNIVLGAGTGWTLSGGSATVANNVWRKYFITLTSATAITGFTYA
ncbi:filamentous hemagglutinin N-terminal domain-containing protein [Undibacterium luofuense]|uniref:filamentous hemagglutinin N-terminal domain-containing protein n=1 Tax=Undibacterium luofuense TaxID=2828733 RepID=UPI003C6F15E7